MELYKSPKQLQRLHFPAEHLAFSLFPSFFFSSSLKACSCEAFYLLRLLQYLTLSLLFPSHTYFTLFHGQVPLDQHEWKKQVLKRVSKVMNYLTRKNSWSCHSFCMYRERSIKRLTLVRITAIWPLKFSFFVAQRCGRLGAGWRWSLRNQYFNLSTSLSLTHQHLWTHSKN